VLFTLSQIIYKDYEEPDETLLEVEFAFPKPTDIVKLLWVDRQPVGFYSIKLKGESSQSPRFTYFLPLSLKIYLPSHDRLANLLPVHDPSPSSISKYALILSRTFSR